MKNLIAMILSLVLSATVIAQTSQIPERQYVAQRLVKATKASVNAYELLIQVMV